MFFRKAISPVVATALLLVVAVVAVVSFQTWNSSYFSSTFSSVETKSSLEVLKIEALIGDDLYLNSNSESNLTLVKIQDSLGQEMCSYSLTSTASDSLVGHWNFENNSATITDLSGNGHHGTFYGGDTILLMNFDSNETVTIQDQTSYNNDGTISSTPIWQNSNCISQGCYLFDGSNDWAEISDSTNLRMNTNDFTISAWIKTADSGTQTIFTKSIGGGPTTSYGYLLTLDPNDRLHFYTASNSTSWGNAGTFQMYDSRFLDDNSWHHVVAIIDRDNQSLSTLYVDGTVGTVTKGGDITSVSPINNTLPVRIGSEAADAFVFNGSIDEVSLYSKALSSSEVSELYSYQKAKFIEFVPSDNSQGLTFDGIDDYVNMGNFIHARDMKTVQAKVKFNDLSTNQEIVSKSQVGQGIELLVYGGGISYYLMGGGISNYAHPISNFDTSSYYTFTIVHNGSNSEINYYVDGTLVDNRTAPSGITDTTNLYFGRWNAAGRFFNGTIDEVKIYNKSLSPLELSQLSFSSNAEISKGVNNFDISECNLEQGKKYSIVAFSTNSKAEGEFIKK